MSNPEEEYDFLEDDEVEVDASYYDEDPITLREELTEEASNPL